MAVTATNLLAGAGTLYTGAFGAAEPTDPNVNTTPSASTWTDTGGTMDGLTVNINREFLELEVDQIPDVAGRRLTKRDIQLATNLAEATLANLKTALNGGTVTVSGAYSTYDPDSSIAAFQPTYTALLFDGFAPATAAGAIMRRRVVVRKTLSVDDVETPYKKDAQTVYPVNFAAHYVSSVILPFRIIDQTT